MVQYLISVESSHPKCRGKTKRDIASKARWKPRYGGTGLEYSGERGKKISEFQASQDYIDPVSKQQQGI